MHAHVCVCVYKRKREESEGDREIISFVFSIPKCGGYVLLSQLLSFCGA